MDIHHKSCQLLSQEVDVQGAGPIRITLRFKARDLSIYLPRLSHIQVHRTVKALLLMGDGAERETD